MHFVSGITCLQSVSAQDGDELLRVLERCVLACLMEQTRQNHSRDQLDTQCDHSAACEQSPNDKNAVGEAL